MDFAFLAELPRLIAAVVSVFGIVGLSILIAGEFARAGLLRHFATLMGASVVGGLLLVIVRLGEVWL